MDLVEQKRYLVGSVTTHTRMNKWLKSYGDMSDIYEIWKHTGVHSRWHWKIKKKKWGRMATPSKKSGNEAKK